MTLKEAEKRIADLEAQVRLLASQIAQANRPSVGEWYPSPNYPTYPYVVTTTPGTTTSTVSWFPTSRRNDDGPEPEAVPA